MKSIIDSIKISCKEASRLALESRDRRLTFKEWISLKRHMIVCAGCKIYKKQMEFLTEVFNQREYIHLSPHHMPTEVKEKLKQRLKEEF